MSNALSIGNRSISYDQAKEMLFPELIPQKGNESALATVPHEKVEDMAGKALPFKPKNRLFEPELLNRVYSHGICWT